MSTKSLAFARMKAALLAYVCDIPVGRVVEICALATALNIPPRHVAYMLSQLRDDERQVVPWHRVVPTACKWPALAKQSTRQIQQIAALELEGVKADATTVQTLAWPLPDTHDATLWADEG